MHLVWNLRSLKSQRHRVAFNSTDTSVATSNVVNAWTAGSSVLSEQIATCFYMYTGRVVQRPPRRLAFPAYCFFSCSSMNFLSACQQSVSTQWPSGCRNHALDEVGLVGARGVDRRGDLVSCSLLGTRHGVVGAAEEGSEPAHGNLRRFVSLVLGGRRHPASRLGEATDVVAAEAHARNVVVSDTGHRDRLSLGVKDRRKWVGGG